LSVASVAVIQNDSAVADHDVSKVVLGVQVPIVQTQTVNDVVYTNLSVRQHLKSQAQTLFKRNAHMLTDLPGDIDIPNPAVLVSPATPRPAAEEEACRPRSSGGDRVLAGT
jgi:hypothetical protein